MGCGSSTAVGTTSPSKLRDKKDAVKDAHLRLSNSSSFGSAVDMGAGGAVSFMQNGKIAAGFPRSPAESGTEASRAKARALAERVMPFVPRRVVRAFAEGFLNGAATGAVTPAPEPRLTDAAVLVLDVSGFTKLSEKYSRQGSKGAEAFTLNISSMFARMTTIIRNFHGDVDCFAGDAVLVLFETRTRRTAPRDSTESACDDLCCAALRAVNCAKEVHQQINGYQSRPDDPPLTIHCALAAGQLYCVECGGSTTSRAEAFVMGPPMKELEAALNQSKTGELLIAPSARQLLSGVSGEDREEGCLCVTMVQVDRAQASVSMRNSRSQNKNPEDEDTFATSTSGEDKLDTSPSKTLEKFPSGLSRFKALSTRQLNVPTKAPPRESLEEAQAAEADVLDEVVGQMHNLIDMKMRATLMTDSDQAAASNRMRSSTRSSIERNLRRSIDNNAITQGMLQGYSDDDTDITHGLEALLNFTPKFVQNACKAGHDLDMLAEHRNVTVLFMIGSLDQYVGEKVDYDALLELQKILGEAIDAAEGQLGGATRQITVDDKGLAMIFVFGLPGFFYHNHTVRCLMAAHKVAEIMKRSHLDVTAGITTGACFCGLIGDLSTRCEYAVMGDVVNTGARLAVQAAKLGLDHLCTEEVRDAAAAQLEEGHTISMSHAGKVKLKGKQGETAVYVSQHDVSRHSFSSNHTRTPPKHRLVGREPELRRLMELLEGTGKDIRMALLDGVAGVGKSALVQSALYALKHDKRPTLQVHCSYEDQTPFITCQNVLKWMLELEGEPEAANFAWIMDDTMMSRTAEELPAMMRPYAAEIAALFRVPPQLKMQELQRVYGRIMLRTLRKIPVIILLEDIQLLDEGSANVLGNIALGAADHIAADGPACAYTKSKPANVALDRVERPSVLLCTSRGDVICDVSMDNEQEVSSLPLHELPCVFHCELHPLPDDAVLDLAQTLLTAGALSPDLKDLVREQSQGIPLYTRELCLWLSNQGLVEVNSATGVVSKKRSSSTVPPSLQRVIQAQIDQLPQGLVVVLRYASVLGKQFSSAMLVQMLPARVAASLAVLEEQLRMLQFLHILMPMPKAVFSVGDSWWQFEQQLHREVVYGSLTHAHKKSLHRQAARLITTALNQQQASQRAGANQEIWSLLQALAKHSLEVVKTGASDATYADLETASNSQMHAAEYLMAIGDIKGAWVFKAQQLEVLHAANKLCHSVSRLDLELNAVRHAIQLLTTALANGIAGPQIRATERLTELRRLEGLLLKALGRSDEADMTSLTSIDEILGASEQQIGPFGDSSQPALASTASRTQLFSQQTSLGRLRASTDSAFPPNTSAAAVAAANGAAGFASAEARVGAASSAFASADARIGVASPLADAIAATEKHGVPPSQALSIDLGFAAAPSVVQQRPMKKASSKDANGFILPTPIKE